MNNSAIIKSKLLTKAISIVVIALITVLLSFEVIAKPTPIHFDKLSTEMQDTLSPLEKKWHRLSPNMQHRIVKRAENTDAEGRARLKEQAARWNNISPEQYKKLRKARKRFDNLPPHKRRELRQHWNSMSPEKRQSLKQYNRLSPAEQREISEKLNRMSNSERRDFADEVHRQATPPSEQ